MFGIRIPPGGRQVINMMRRQMHPKMQATLQDQAATVKTVLICLPHSLR